MADSAAALGVKSGEKWLGKFVTKDHKPNMKGERERIEKSGAKIGFDGTNHRVYAKDSRYPGLNMSRCLGDTLGVTLKASLKHFLRSRGVRHQLRTGDQQALLTLSL